MPAQSRSQRKRQAARQQTQTRRPPAAISTPAAEEGDAVSTGPTVRLNPPAASVAARTNRPIRRTSTRPAPEPVDYSKDYTAARRDLRWIALWSVLLFAGMFVLKISGLV
jgi:hypothetical protein